MYYMIDNIKCILYIICYILYIIYTPYKVIPKRNYLGAGPWVGFIGFRV